MSLLLSIATVSVCHAVRTIHYLQGYYKKWFYPRYVWITSSWYDRDWWKQDNGNSSCTPEIMREMLNGSLAITPIGNLVSDDRQAQTISGLVSISVSVVENASPLLLQCITTFMYPLILHLSWQMGVHVVILAFLSVFAVRRSDSNFQLLQIVLNHYDLFVKL